MSKFITNYATLYSKLYYNLASLQVNTLQSYNKDIIL